MRLLLALALAAGLFPALGAQALAPDLQLRVDIAYLASDLLGGRASGSRFGDEAAEYVAARMQQIGLEGIGDAGTFYQRFPITVGGHGRGQSAPALYTSNVLGYLDRGAASTVLIGAHYDHLGFGGSGSLYIGEPAPHNGADDNASGVAVMLDLAARLKADEGFRKYNLLFVGFGAEEMGLIGSKYLAAHLPDGLPPLAAMLNFDMVGRLSGEGVLAVNGAGTSPIWHELLDRANAGRVTYRFHESGLGPSDHASFYLEDVPVLHFFTGQHPQYHKPDDDVVLINFPGVRTLADLVYDLVRALPTAAPAFAKTKDTSTEDLTSFKVTMGVMPDYVFGGTGLRIDGVLSDRPAEKAGLQRGDVILKIASKDIRDIYGYMEALGEHETGQTVELLVLRDGRKLRKKLTF